MNFKIYSTLISVVFILINSCQSYSVVNPNSLQNPPSLLSEMSCDQIIEKSKDPTFSLKGLAGIRAHKNCKNFKYDFSQLTDFEKRLYAEEIDELDPKKKPPVTSLTVTELKKNLKEAVTPEEKFKAYKQLRAKQKNQGLRNDYLKTTADLFNWSKSLWKKDKKQPETIQRFYESTLLLARTYWTEDKVFEAEKTLNESLRLLKGLTSVAEIYHIKGRIFDEKNSSDLAVKNYDLALEDIEEMKPKSISVSVDRLMWLKSWILYKNKTWDQAQKSFDSLASKTTDNSEKSKALFFQSRCLQQLGQKEEAQKTLERILKEDSFTFYGLVSYNELGLKLPALNQLAEKLATEKKFQFDLELSFLAETEKKLFKDLIKYKEIDLAERAVGFLAKSSDAVSQVNLGLYLAANGERYLPLFAGFSKLDNNDKMQVLTKYPDLLFPQPHLDEVKAMSEKTQIPTSLIYSIMKQESAFNEKTRSHADAMGLMQMIPRLAKQISKKFDVKYTKPEDLYNPLINIQLGSFELMEQIKKQSGQLTYVAAAYNAGPNALGNWLKTKKNEDIVEFIEEIPYDETRTYVKIIARNKLFYERISKRDEEHPFPIEFLVKPIMD